MRSLLVVRGDSRAALDRALGSGADAVIVDLRDAVPPASRSDARRLVGALGAEAGRIGAAGPLLFVRVGGLRSGHVEADLDAVMASAPAGIVLPGAVGGRDVQHLAAEIAVREAENALSDGSTRILPVATDSAAGLLAVATIVGASRRLCGLVWEPEDLAADLGADVNRDACGGDAAPVRHARTLALAAAAAAGVDAIDAAFTAVRDLDGLAAACRDARRDGFTAKIAIHPEQVPVINAAFSPSPDAVAEAAAVVAAFGAEPGSGIVSVGGRGLDRSHLARARRVLVRAGNAVAGPPR